MSRRNVDILTCAVELGTHGRCGRGLGTRAEAGAITVEAHKVRALWEWPDGECSMRIEGHGLSRPEARERAPRVRPHVAEFETIARMNDGTCRYLSSRPVSVDVCLEGER